MSSMVQDAYDMGLTTSLGGMPNSSLYDYSDYYEDNSNSIEEYGTDYEKNDKDNDVEITLEIGDTVKLNSNDKIIMTVHDIYDDQIVCRWFDKNHILQSATFNPLELNILQKNSISNQDYNNPLNNISEIDKDEIPW